MIAVDTNVLVYAHRAETRAHAQAQARLRAIAEAEIPWALPVFCLAEFLRVVTHPRVFTPPSPLETALAFLDAILESPGVRLLLPGERFPRLLREAASDARATGNLAFDAQIAALCLEHGVSLLTADRDFARFGGLLLQPL